MRDIDFNYYKPSYEYEPKRRSERIGDDNTIFLMILIGCTVALAVIAILLILVTNDYPILWWPLIILRFACKWIAIIGWPIWLIIEIVKFIMRGVEQQKINRKLAKEDEENYS